MPAEPEILVEECPDCFVAYVKGQPVVGQGATQQEAEADCRSAWAFHTETFAKEAL